MAQGSPYVDKDGQKVLKDRLVAKQPLTFSNEEEKREVFNLRKLSELPHHLLHAGDLKRLKEETLCNFEFLLAKLRGTSLESVLDDFARLTPRVSRRGRSDRVGENIAVVFRCS